MLESLGFDRLNTTDEATCSKGLFHVRGCELMDSTEWNESWYYPMIGSRPKRQADDYRLLAYTTTNTERRQVPAASS